MPLSISTVAAEHPLKKFHPFLSLTSLTFGRYPWSPGTVLNLSPELLRPNMNSPGKDVVPSGGRNPPEERLSPRATSWLQVAVAGQLGVWVGNAINSMCRGIREKNELPTGGS